MGQAMDRPRMGRGQHARAVGRATQEKRHAKVHEKGKKDVFSFSRGKIGGRLLCPPGGDRERVAAIAALGRRHRRENVARATAARGGARVKPSL